MATLTWGNVLTQALTSIGAYGVEDPVDSAEMQQTVFWANALLDSWSALKRYAYTTTFTVFEAVGSHTPILIGPGLTSSGDFATVPAGAPRPVRIESAAQLLNNGSSVVDLPMNIRDDDWWADNQTKLITSSVATDLYYSADWPNGVINLWPVLNVAAQIRMQLWTVIQSIPVDGNGNADLTQEFSAAQGYRLAFTLTLGEQICDVFARPMPPTLPQRAFAARAALFSNNVKSPRIASADFGTRGRAGYARGGGGGFNWTNGQPG